jgi:hypothetical protein
MGRKLNIASTDRAWVLMEDNLSFSGDTNKWNEVARSVFLMSKGKYFRTGKQCR